MIGGQRSFVETDVPCDACGCTTWSVGIIIGPAEPDGDGAAFVNVSAAPMARCAACSNSQRLDA